MGYEEGEVMGMPELLGVLALAVVIGLVAAGMALLRRRTARSGDGETAARSPIRQDANQPLSDGSALPFPPLELRTIVGPTDDAAYDNPGGDLVWGDLAYGPLQAGEAYRRAFDFGCGCGRNARQLLLQRTPPDRIVGIDISRQLIDWCTANLRRPGVEVEFHHHDVWNLTYAPDNSKNDSLPLQDYGSDFTLVNAHSVFTHLLEHQTLFYLRECREILAENGLLRTTWFLLNRDWFPVLAPHQHCIYVNETDPTQAVYYDWGFLTATLRDLGLKIIDVTWTLTPGFQSVLMLAKGNAFEDISAGLQPPGTILGFGPSLPPEESASG